MSWEGVKREHPALGLPIQTHAPLTLLDNTPLERTVNGRLSGREEMGLILKESGEGDGSNNNPQTSPAAEPPSEELRMLLLAQLEYYFSPENLSNDKFLVSQMDSDQYVYISTVANFNLIKKLTSDLDLITDVLRKSKQVQVHSDGKRVRPISNRTVVILRGIPESTPIEEIKALFETENSPRCNQCEFAFNDSWYLSFDSDEDAVRAHRYLREEVREFKGQPIMARIKSRPTTLLSQGSLGVNPLKNGYHQPSSSLPPYIPAAYVPVSQNGPPSSVTTTNHIYPQAQQASSVFTLPQSPYLTFGGQMPWTTGFYDMSQVLFNGIPTPSTHSAQPSPKYASAQPMPPRHRPPKPDSDSFHGPPRGGGPPRRPNSSSESLNGSVNGPGHYGGPSGAVRKNGPAPLLGLAPQQSLPVSSQAAHVPHSHNQTSQPLSSAALSSGQTSGGGSGPTSVHRNGHPHYSSLPPHSVPHLHHEPAYHRNYRGDNHSRPRSSLGTRRPVGRGREDEGGYESSGPLVGPSRGIPSVRHPAHPHSSPLSPSVPPPPLTPSTNHATPAPRNDFDLEVSAFPPLPGSLNPPTAPPKTDESPYEGRLSDVVKGVKSLGVREKDERESEIVVSAEFGESCAYVVSVASPTRELEGRKSSQAHSPTTQTNNKKYREVGVGSADDNHDIRASTSKECVVKGTKGKETADKSTQVKQPLVKPQPNPMPQNALKKPNGNVVGRDEKDGGGGETRKKDVGSGNEAVKEICSKDEPEGPSGPVRLSYAQVAQRSGAEKGPAPVPAPQPPPSNTSTSPANSGSSGGDDRPKRPSNYVNKDPPRQGSQPFNSKSSYKRPAYKRDRLPGPPMGPGLRDRQ